MVEGTITARLLDRASGGFAELAGEAGTTVTIPAMAVAIADAVLDPTLSAGTTVVVGGDLDTLLRG